MIKSTELQTLSQNAVALGDTANKYAVKLEQSAYEQAALGQYRSNAIELSDEDRQHASVLARLISHKLGMDVNVASYGSGNFVFFSIDWSVK